MSAADALQINPIGSKTLYKYHSNVSREIALVDFLNDEESRSSTARYASTNCSTVFDQEDMYRMGKKQELKVH